MSAPDLISRALAVYHERGAGAQLGSGDVATVDAAMRAWHGGDAPPVVAAFRGSDEHEGEFFLYFAGKAPAVVANVLSGTVTWARTTPEAQRFFTVSEEAGALVLRMGKYIRAEVCGASPELRARLLGAQSDDELADLTPREVMAQLIAGVVQRDLMLQADEDEREGPVAEARRTINRVH